MRTTPQPDLPVDPALDSRLAELRERFKAVLPERIRTVRARIAALPLDQADAPAIEDLRTEVHSLAGSSGLFGCDDVGAAAAALERMVIAAAKSSMVTRAAKEEMLDAMNRLDQTVHQSRN